MQARKSRAIRRDGSMGLASTLSLWVSTETTTRILAVVFLLPQLPQCFQRDSEILALGRSEISAGRVKELFRSAAHSGWRESVENAGDMPF